MELGAVHVGKNRRAFNPHPDNNRGSIGDIMLHREIREDMSECSSVNDNFQWTLKGMGRGYPVGKSGQS